MASPATDSPQNVPPSFSLQPYYMNSKIIISALTILFFIVFLAALLHIYAKWSSRRRRRTSIWYFPGPFQPPTPHQPLTRGLDKAVVESLPIFAYKKNPSLPAGPNSFSTTSLECAVCLSEFQEDEKCRLLPACNHSFHTECIDIWFLTNTTCPLCRTSAEPPPEEDHDAESFITCLLPSDSRAEDMRELGVGLRSGNDEEETEDHRRNAYGVSNGELDFGDGETARHVSFGQTSSEGARAGARSWRRSISDRFPSISQNVQFPTNVLFWGNNSHMNSRMNPEHWLIGGRSLPHIVLDIGRTQENLIQHHGSSSSDEPSLCSSLDHQTNTSSHVPRPFHRFKSLQRLLSRDKKTPPLMDDAEESTPPSRG